MTSTNIMLIGANIARFLRIFTNLMNQVFMILEKLALSSYCSN